MGMWDGPKYDPKYDPQIPASPDTWKKTPGKKNTNKWCKGKVGREHAIEIVIPHNHSSWKRFCGYYHSWFGWRKQQEDGVELQKWHCAHAEVCKNCGKQVRWQLSAKDCPVRLDNPVERTVRLSQ